MTKRWSHNYQFQVNYTLSWDKSDDDNERDPFTYRYIRYDNLDAEYGYSDRDQRHRLNGVLLWLAPGKVNVNLRYSYRSAQPLSLSATGAVSQTVFGPTSDRIRADGSIVERNTGRKDNEYSSLDLRLAREFALSKRVSDRADLRGLQPVQLQEPARAPDHQPGLQLRRHDHERPRRPRARCSSAHG